MYIFSKTSIDLTTTVIKQFRSLSCMPYVHSLHVQDKNKNIQVFPDNNNYDTKFITHHLITSL